MQSVIVSLFLWSLNINLATCYGSIFTDFLLDTGWNQFDLDFFVSAPKTSSIDGSHHRMTIFDNRLVPGDTADFPAVSWLDHLA